MGPVVCGECGAPMRLVDRSERAFYGCTRYPACRGTHGAHPDGRPMGVPANAATRAARKRAHAVFDRLWEGPEASMERQEAYRWMRFTLELRKIDAHISMFDEWRCADLIAALQAPTFEIRWVDAWNRTYVKIAATWFFHDACLTADIACQTGDDYIVWDRVRRRVMYDSRERKPLPIGEEEDDDEEEEAGPEYAAEAA